jgi:hypothetical protein
MANLARFTRDLTELDVVKVFDDFVGDQSDITFVDTITDSGTVLMGDDVNGVATLTPSDGTVADNDEAYLASANELFKFGTNRQIYGRAKLRFTEVTATIANVAFGFQNAVGANSIVDDGGGLKVSGSTLGIYKIDGSAVWKCVSSCNGTSTVSTSTKAATAATDYVLEIEVNDWDGVSMQVSFKVDGEYLKDSLGQLIRHTVAIASATEMQVFVGIKLGAITNNDTLLADYVYASQTRI